MCRFSSIEDQSLTDHFAIDHFATDRRKRQIVRMLQFDRATIEILKAFSSADVPALLLKGTSFRTWLYSREGRAQVDVDILVPQDTGDRQPRALSA
jgi:hypothetical protein